MAHKSQVASNGCKFFEKRNLRIGIISDEFFYKSIKDSADFIYLTKNNWPVVLGTGIDVFLFETAWTGIDSEWCGFAWPGHNETKEILSEILTVCKHKKIPTIFYSKEDPPDFYTFLDSAKQFDYVFTSAVECIESYRSLLGHNNIYAASFCFSPIYNNPIGLNEEDQENAVLFAGAWYDDFKERCTDMQVIFDGVIKSRDTKLVVIDRNLKTKSSENSQFPKIYHDYISPAVEHGLLQKLHKKYKWAININSIKDSRTMFANRTFELLANGNLIISNYSTGVNDQLPTILLAESSESVKEILDNTTKEDQYQLQIDGIRSVMSKHTCFHRLEEFLKPLGLSLPVKDRKVLVVLENKDYLQSFLNQTYKDKSYVLLTDLNENLIKKYDILCWFGGGFIYEPFYLEDLVNGFKYTNSDFITKNKVKTHDGNVYINNGKEHAYTKKYTSKFLTAFWLESYTYTEIVDEEPSVTKEGYAIDCLNVYPVHSGIPQNYNCNFKISVVVPLHNNGERFIYKGFNSLKRSSIFKDLQIILIDDCSTDDTPTLINNLSIRHSNVICKFLTGTPSGSASVPRNVGSEIATAPYIIYMDSDDEILNDGYNKLYQEIVRTGADVVFSNNYLFGRETRLYNIYDDYKKYLGKDFFEKNLLNILVEANFQTPCITTILFKRDLLDKYQVKKFVEGAFAEDTLFTWNLMALPIKTTMINLPTYAYYNSNQTSVTNAISSRFFKASLESSAAIVEFLKKNEIYNAYMDRRFRSYILDWVLPKLHYCTDSEKRESCLYSMKLISNFVKYGDIEDITIRKFVRLCIAGDYDSAINTVPNFKYKIRNFGTRNKPIFIKEGGTNNEEFEWLKRSVLLLSSKNKIQFKYQMYKILVKKTGILSSEKMHSRYAKYLRLHNELKLLKKQLPFI